MKKADITAILERYNLSPNKRLGQNFLINDEVVARIVDTIAPAATDRILEIGPGLGALTGALLARGCGLTAVEIDAGFARYLADTFGGNPAFDLRHADFLKTQPEGEFAAVVSNLPYYCASEILFTIAARYRARRVYVMVQKEVADRMTAQPDTEEYGALTVSLGFYFEARVLFGIGKNDFQPRPEVQSSFLRLERRDPLPLAENEIDLFHRVVKAAFWGRRKTLARALTDSPHLDLARSAVEQALSRAGIDPGARGETLGLERFTSIVRELEK